MNHLTPDSKNNLYVYLLESNICYSCGGDYSILHRKVHSEIPLGIGWLLLVFRRVCGFLYYDYPIL